MIIRAGIYLLFIFCISLSLEGQIEYVPIIENQRLDKPQSENILSRSANINLPFFEDFSDQSGPYPSQKRWSDRDVFVNNTLGVDPVSLGIATFDGIGPDGIPYGGGYGSSDTLTSLPINTSSGDDNIYLSFYLQKGGLALGPETQDSLILRFYDNTGNWRKIRQWEKNTLNSTDTFYFYSVKLNNRYLHDDFRFQFYNYSDNEGMADTWHIDYIKVGREFSDNIRRETDIAFTKNPGNLLARYSAMPWWQLVGFVSSEIRDSIEIELFNHFDNKLQADSSFFSVRFKNSSNRPIGSETLLEVPPIVSENQRDLDPGRHRFVNAIKSTGYKSAIGDFLSNEPGFTLETNYIYRQAQEGDIGTVSNNRVGRENKLRDYYGYDDESAEVGLQFNRGPGAPTALAVQFQAHYPDTVEALQIMFPRIANEDESQRFTLHIWGPDLNADPIFSSKIMSPRFLEEEIMEDTLQAILTLDLAEITSDSAVTTVTIDPGDFYIGWRQISSTQRGVAVGFDRNSTDATRYLYYFNGSVWNPLSEVSASVTGAVIFRPVMVNPFEPPVSTDYKQPLSKSVLLYPNPARDFINLKEFNPDLIKTTRYVVYDISGRIVNEGMLKENRIEIASLNPGRYMLALHTGSGPLARAIFVKL